MHLGADHLDSQLSSNSQVSLSSKSTTVTTYIDEVPLYTYLVLLSGRSFIGRPRGRRRLGRGGRAEVAIPQLT